MSWAVPCQDAHAQVSQEWELSGDTYRDFVVDPAGHVFVGGESRIGSRFGSFAARYDDGGSKIWESVLMTYRYGGRRPIIELDAKGDLIVAMQSGAGTTSNPYSVFVTKLDGSNGSRIWSWTRNILGGSNTPIGIAIDSAGDVAVVGNAIPSPYTYLSIFVAKLDGEYNSQGQLVWLKTFGKPHMTSSDIAVDRRGDVFVTGDLISKDGSHDWLTFKLHGHNGNLVRTNKGPWVKTYGFTHAGLDRAYEIAIDPKGDVYVAGESDNFNRDYAIIKYSGEDGRPMWSTPQKYPNWKKGERRFDAGQDDRLWAQVFDVNSGSIVVTGESALASGGTDFRTIKYDATDGSVVWSTGSDFALDDVASAVDVDRFGHVYVYGDTHPGGATVVKLDADDGMTHWTFQSPNANYSHTLRLDSQENVFVSGSRALVKCRQDPLSLTFVPAVLKGGQAATFTVTNGAPQEATYLLYSRTNPGLCNSRFLPKLNVLLSLCNPVLPMTPTMISDLTGSASWNVQLPKVVAPTEVWLQAIQMNKVTDIVAATILP